MGYIKKNGRSTYRSSKRSPYSKSSNYKIGGSYFNKTRSKGSASQLREKYTKLAKEYLSSKDIQPDIIYLRGSQEIAPSLNLSDVIIDLVESGRTLTENSLVELDVIRNISSRLIANKAALKTKGDLIEELKSELDRWGLFKYYEDRFLSLFRRHR